MYGSAWWDKINSYCIYIHFYVFYDKQNNVFFCRLKLLVKWLDTAMLVWTTLPGFNIISSKFLANYRNGVCKTFGGHRNLPPCILHHIYFSCSINSRIKNICRMLFFSLINILIRDGNPNPQFEIRNLRGFFLSHQESENAIPVQIFIWYPKFLRNI